MLGGAISDGRDIHEGLCSTEDRILHGMRGRERGMGEEKENGENGERKGGDCLIFCCRTFQQPTVPSRTSQPPRTRMTI